jgi:transposase
MAAATNRQEVLEHGRPKRLGWAKLLKRVFNLDLTCCPHCGGELRIIAAILQRQAIEKILNHLTNTRPVLLAAALRNVRGQAARRRASGANAFARESQDRW